MDIGIIFGQMLVLLAMMMIGYFAYRAKWIDESSAGHLSKLVVNVFNPILVINGVLGQNSGGGGEKIIQNIVLVIAYFGILVAVSILIPVILRPKTELKSLYQLMTIFGNIGFMGIPVIKSIFGNEAIIYVAFYILAYNIMLYTCGMFLANRSAGELASEKTVAGKAMTKAARELSEVKIAAGQEKASFLSSLKRMINPGVVAALVAVIIFVTGPAVPEAVYTFCDYMGNATIPLSMFLIGVSVAQENLKEIFGDLRIYLLILIRMIVLPIGMIFLLRGFLLDRMQVDPVVFGVFILELGMPIGSIIALLAREQGADAGYCTKGVVLSTLVSIVTIPVICMFL